MKVVIVTAYYAPMNVPRAFRATELARELARRGHEVTVVNATTLVDSSGNALLEKESDINLINLGILKFSVSQGTTKSFFYQSQWKKLLKKWSFYFTTNVWLLLYKGLRSQLVFNQKYDLLISIGLPFAVHWGVAEKIEGKNIANCYIADYGDPFSKYNQSIKVAKYFQWIEKRSIAKYDFISVPTEKAIKSYLWLKPSERIKVIPQGINFANIKRAEYIRNEVPTFAYAGLFYSDIRNPRALFEWLIKCTFEFHFIVYTNIDVADSFLCIKPYLEQLGNKLEIRNIIPRMELIYQLSTMDFIVNIDNLTSNQAPSKLIDYSLSKRPIFSFTQNSFEEERFMRFCSYNFDANDAIDVKPFDIVCVADKFEELYKSL